MTPTQLIAWFAIPGTATLDLSETIDMRGQHALKGSGKTINGGKIIRAKMIANDCAFIGTEFSSAPVAGETYEKAVACYADGSKRVTFERCVFGGGNLGQGIGLRANDAEDITVKNCEFKDGYQGPSFVRGKRIAVLNNNIHDVGENGITVAGCVGLTIRGNFIHDITPVNGAHPDAIQTWTNRDGAGVFYPVNDVLIEDNVILQGSGGGMQGIFHRSRANALATTPLEDTMCHNWVVRRNLVYGFAYTNAIYLNEGARNVSITDNLVLSPLDAVQGWIYAKGCEGLEVAKNVSNGFRECPADVLRNNVQTKDVAALIPDLAKRALATEAGLWLQAGGVRLMVG